LELSASGSERAQDLELEQGPEMGLVKAQVPEMVRALALDSGLDSEQVQD
jgi:hypothetical protein